MSTVIQPQIAVIVNPNAGAGRAASYLPGVEAALRKARCEYQVLRTREPGDGTRLAVQARESGASAIAVLGGDGTLNEVGQAYVGADQRAIPGPAVALICAGSGDDFGRNIAGCNPGAGPGSLDRLVHLRTRTIDLGLLTLQDGRGGTIQRVFVNISSLGISGRVDELVARGPKYLGGRAAFFLATVAALLTYRNVPIEIHLDGRPWYSGKTYLAAIANGQFFAAGTRIAPRASLNDGAFDVVCLGDLSRRAATGMESRVRRGQHLELRDVHSARAQRVEVRCAHELLVDVDGETPGYAPLVAQVVPGAMRIIED